MNRGARSPNIADIKPRQGWLTLKQTYKKGADGKFRLDEQGQRIPSKAVWYGQADVLRGGKKKVVTATADALGDRDAQGKQRCCDLLDERVQEAKEMATLWSAGIVLEPGETRAAALQRLADERAGRVVARPSLAPTLEEHWERWFAHQCNVNRGNTCMSYLYHWEHHIAPHPLAKTRLDAIDTLALQRWYAWLGTLTNQRVPGKPISMGTKVNAVARLRTMMREAHLLRDPKTGQKWVLDADVVKDAKLTSGQPVVRRSKRAALGGNDPSVLDGLFDYYLDLGDTSEHRRARTMLALLRLGLRPSEALAVLREDITFNEDFQMWQVWVDKQIEPIYAEKKIVGYNTTAPTKRSKTGFAYCPEWLSDHLLATRQIELRDREQVRTGPRKGKAWVTHVRTVEPTFAVPAIRSNERNRGMEHVTVSYLADTFGKAATAAGLPDAYPYLMRAQLNTELARAITNDKDRARAMRQSRVLDDHYLVESDATLAAAMRGVKKGG